MVKEQKRKWFVILIVILVVGVVGLGLTYAYWTLSFTQENSNFVTSDCFHITFDGKNDINLQNAYPMSDDELYDFYQSATPYHFVIENTCAAEATAIINLETIGRDNKLDDKYIETILYNGEKNYLEIIKSNSESADVYSRKRAKRPYSVSSGEVNFYNYQLTNNPVNQNKVIEDSVTAYKLYEFKFNGKGKREFNLLQYMYQETPANENTINKTFESKITVTTAYKPTIPTNVLAVRGCGDASGCTDETRVFQTDYIKNATKIVFQNKMNPPATFVSEFDESEGKDGSVKAYVVQNGDNMTYTIYFQGNGNFAMTNSNYYFEGFSKVEEIEGLKYVDTEQVTSMNHMFSGMESLKSLDLSRFDTSNVTNMLHMFSNVSSLTSLDLSTFDTSQVTDFGYMFCAMKNLTDLNLNGFDTSKATSMSGMFIGANSLESLDLSVFDTNNVVDMSWMFAFMTNLTDVNLSGFDTSSVTNMSSMFEGMTSLTSLDLRNFDTSKVTNISYMFKEMKNLMSLNLRSFDTSEVTNMSGMFYNAVGLTSLDISHFNTSKVTNMNIMFYGVSSLTELDLSNFDTNNVGNMNSMFENAFNLISITYGQQFIRKVDSEVANMFNNCPANKPTHSSWNGAFES